MGYRATKSAMDTLKALVPGNKDGTNCWRTGNVDYFYQVGAETPDASIVGEVWRSEAAMAYFVGYFKITKDGIVVNFPGLKPLA